MNNLGAYNYQNPYQNFPNIQQQQALNYQQRLQQLEALQQPIQNQQLPQLAYVNGVEGAKAFQIPPNSSIMLIDNTNDIFYIKSSDNMYSVTIKAFEYKEILQQDNSNSNPQNIDVSKFATQDELYELRDKIEQLSKELGINENEKPKEEPKKANKKGGE